MDFVDAVDMFGGDDDTSSDEADEADEPAPPARRTWHLSTPPTKEEPRWPRSFVRHHDKNPPPVSSFLLE